MQRAGQLHLRVGADQSVHGATCFVDAEHEEIESRGEQSEERGEEAYPADHPRRKAARGTGGLLELALEARERAHLRRRVLLRRALLRGLRKQQP